VEADGAAVEAAGAAVEGGDVVCCKVANVVSSSVICADLTTMV
jgi:hypothetical protein